MNAHIPQNITTEIELRQLAATPFQIINPGSNKPLIGIFQDSLLGSFRFTRKDIKFTPREAMNMLMSYPHVDVHELRRLGDTVSNFDILSQITPPITLKYKTGLFDEDTDDAKDPENNNVLEIYAGKYKRGQIEKSVFESASKGILHRICNDFGNMACADYNDNVQNIVTEYMKTSSFSVGISDLIADRQTNDMISDVIRLQKMEVQTIIDKIHLGIFENNTAATNKVTFELVVSNILNKATEESGKIGKKSLSKDNRFLMIVNSGSKGNLHNISQMVSCLGQQSVDGKRISYGFDDRTLPHFKKYDDSPNARGFVENSYITGLTAPELFFHAMAGRTGLIDTAVKSVTRETKIVILENDRPVYTEIGAWIDAQLDATNNKDLVEHSPNDRNLELLHLQKKNVYIPTTDEDGTVTWGEVTAITRHDPGHRLYEVVSQSGRKVTVAESQSLLVWDATQNKFLPKPSPDLHIGDYMPVTASLVDSPVVVKYVDMTQYLPKDKYVYGSDFNTAIDMIATSMEGHSKIPPGWWKQHNGSEFTLPYTKKSSVQRTSVRSNIGNIQSGCVYPYHARRTDARIPDSFPLNEENGIFIGLFLAEGNANNDNVIITNNHAPIQLFVQKWFDKHGIVHKMRERTNRIGGTTTTVVGNCSVLSTFLTAWVGHGAANKHVPTDAFVAPQEFVVGLLNGYFSGDGTVSKKSIEVGSASERLIEGISMLCSRFGIFGKVFKTQLKSNNLGTKNILPTYRLSIRAQWGQIFTKTIPLLEENKHKKLQSIEWGMSHRNFKTHNDVVLDPIVSIQIVGVEQHPKLYDLTIPSTLNFGLANGLQVRDTSSTGYIQRRLVKGLEDLMVAYDMTVRNNKGKIIQFTYGDDNFDAMKVENQSLPLSNMSIEDIYMHYDMPGMAEAENNLRLSIFTKEAITRMNKQRDQCRDKCYEYATKLVESRDRIMKYVYNYQNENSVRMPVAFQYIIQNIQGQLDLKGNSAVDVTPLEAFDMIEYYFQKINSIVPTNELFRILYFYHLTPRDLLVKRRFHKKGLTLLMETILLKYKEALVHPGEMVGVVGAQCIGEPTTQLTLNSIIWSEKIVLRNKFGSIKICPIGEFIEEQIKKSKKIDYMADKDTTYAELDIEEEYYETPGANEAGETVWRRVEAVTQHPVINEDGTNTMLKVTTKGGREVTATKAKSFLQLVDGKIVGVNGKDLKVGDYLPVSIKPLECTETFTLDLRKVLPPTEYIYGTEMEKASKVMHEHHWWKKHAGTTFVVPFSRSDSVLVAIQDSRKGRPRKVFYEPGMVYTKCNTICNYQIPEVIDMDYDFGYLMGAYCAEGCTTKFQMSISNNDPAYFAPIIRLCEKYNVTYKMYKQENKIQEGWTSSDMRIYSSLLTRMVGELGGKLSHLKYVSPLIVFSNKQCIMGFLDAYIGGDGHINQYRNTSGEQYPTSISVTSTSHIMLRDVSVMLRNIGIASYIHSNKLQTHNNRGTLPENIHQIHELTIRNGQCKKLASILNLAIAQKQEKVKHLIDKPYKYECNKFDDLSFPNMVDGEVVMEPRDGRMMDLQFDPIVSIEEVQNPTSYAYDLTVVDTRNFDLYNGLSLKDTFHSAGIASKSNVTRGVPRIEEILRLTKNPKNPSMTVHMKPSDETDQDKINQFAILMGHTKLVDVVKSIQICFDPNPDATQISEDEPLLEQFYEFEKMVEDCMDVHAYSEGQPKGVQRSMENTTAKLPNRSKWIIRMEMDQNSLMDKSITMDDIHFAISNSEYGKDVQCIFSDYNMDKLVFRIRTNASMFDKNAKKARGVANPLDQSDDIYLLKNFQDTLLNNIVLRGVNGITNVLPRKIQNSMVKEDDKYVKKETWVLDTTGSNLLETLALDYIDYRRTYSNDIKEIFNVLGIEAARQCIHNELVEVMAFSGASINYHHTSLLCDRMTCNKNMVSIFRSGLLNDNVGPIAKATFEVHTEVFLTAARHAELDHMCGVSANIMCGQHGVYGTNACQIILDMKAFDGVKGVPYKQTNTAVEIERGMTKGAETAAACTTTQIDIQNNIVNIRHTGEDVTTCYDDGYNVGF